MSNLFQRLSRTATRVWAFKLPLNHDCSCWFGAFWAYYVITSTQPFSLIYRRRFLCLSSALLLACAFSQRSFAWPLLLRPDRLITTKLLGEIKTFLFLHGSFLSAYLPLLSPFRPVVWVPICLVFCRIWFKLFWDWIKLPYGFMESISLFEPIRNCLPLKLTVRSDDILANLRAM